MKSPKEINLEEKILDSLLPEKLNGETIPYEVAKILIDDPEIAEIQNYANHVSIVRLGYNDHGPVHMRTVARNCIKMMKILHEAKIETSLEKEKIGTFTDSLTAILLASFMHDLGMTVGRQDHELYSVTIALPIIDRILKQVLKDDLQRRIVIRSVAMEGIVGHMGTHKIHSLEAGMILIGDGCDMTKGRARIPIALFNGAKVGDIHKYSANSIEKVKIFNGLESDRAQELKSEANSEIKPICIEVEMSSEVGFFQIEEVLIQKINSSPVRPYISLYAGITGQEFKKYL
ncbi:MAG: phosphohydrolase [Spirochaetaceae bacterium]|nr:phosphohydrolase [Spirochaetaceae bacterium]